MSSITAHTEMRPIIFCRLLIPLLFVFTLATARVVSLVLAVSPAVVVTVVTVATLYFLSGMISVASTRIADHASSLTGCM